MLCVSHEGKLFCFRIIFNLELFNITIDEEDLDIIEIENVTAVSCCSNSIFILNSEGKVYIYENNFNQNNFYENNCILRNEIFHYGKNLIHIPLPAIESIHCGLDHIVAVTITGDVYLWANNNYLRLGPTYNFTEDPFKLSL